MSLNLTYITGYSFNQGEEPSKAFDGNNNTKWCGEQTTNPAPYAIVDAGDTYELTGYIFGFYGDTSSWTARTPNSWTIYGSNTYNTDPANNSWEPIVAETGHTEFSNGDYTFSISNAGCYRYYCIVIDSNNGNGLMQISEIKLNGDPCIPSSILLSVNSKKVSSPGETFSVDVTCPNYWTASVLDGSWVSLSSTADTGNTTITVTVDSNSGATARTNTVTFIDGNTTDEAVLTITQKKQQSGQPMYLGGDEISEFYLGGDVINEMYLGDTLVYSSGPFQGLKLVPSLLTLKSALIETGSTAKISVKSSENWTLSTDADWFTISPSTGTGTGEKEEVTITVTSIPSAETTSVISCTTANYSASTEVYYKLGYGIPANEIWYATIDGTRITSLNNWQVYDMNNVLINSQCDFSTYGKLVFNSDIGCVKDSIYQTGNGWQKLTELGLPEMSPTLCVGSNSFGCYYLSGDLPYWTRVYGDYPNINEEETMAWGMDGKGGIVVRGDTGTLVIPEGVTEIFTYEFSRAKFSSLEFPTTITRFYNWTFEDMSNVSSIKYNNLTAPSSVGSAWNRVNGQGIAYRPVNGINYETAGLKPQNFTWQTY